MANDYGVTSGLPMARPILPGQQMTYQDMRETPRPQLQALGLPVSQAGQRMATFSGPAVVGGAPAAPAPAPDAAAQRAQQLRGAGLPLYEAMNPVPTARALVSSIDGTASNVLGHAASFLGATEFGAGQMRRAEAQGRNTIAGLEGTPQGRAILGLLGAGAPTAAAAVADGQGQDTSADKPAPRKEVSSAAQAENTMRNNIQALEGVTQGQLRAMAAGLPGRPAPMAPRDRVVEDLRQAELMRHMQVMNNDPSVEQASASTRQMQSLMLMLLGNDMPILPGT